MIDLVVFVAGLVVGEATVVLALRARPRLRREVAEELSRLVGESWGGEL